MNKCQICSKYFEDSDTYEYRGFMSCEPHFDELQSKVDYKRGQVMETIEHATNSQRKGEFANNSSKYNINNVASDGLPIMKIKEPQIEQDYRNGIL